MQQEIKFQDIVTFAVLFFGVTVIGETAIIYGFFSKIGLDFLPMVLDGNYLAMAIRGGAWGFVIFLSFGLTKMIFDEAMTQRLLRVRLFKMYMTLTIAICIVTLVIELIDTESVSTVRVVMWTVSLYFVYIFCLWMIALRIAPMYGWLVVPTVMMVVSGFSWGQWSADRALNHGHQYRIQTENRNYANATLLMSTSNAILIKSGKEIIFYNNDHLISMTKDDDQPK